jgi:hypothetical protein
MITITELLNIGFTLDYPRVQESEFSYECYSLTVNDSYMTMTYEFGPDNQCRNHYLTINDRDLEGRKPYIKELRMLKEIL